MAYQIKIIIGKNHQRRGVAFLISEKNEDRKTTAKTVFDGLDETNERLFRARFDWWQSGQPNKPSRYHGWNRSEYRGRYTKCFVFKYKSHRFYGFLCNPKEKNRRYQACILVRHVNKKEWETDETDLKYVEEKRINLTIRKIINDFFKE